MKKTPVKEITPDFGPVPERVLLIQTAFLGDVILTLPLLDAASKLWPKCEITTLTLPSTASIFSDHPAVHGTIVLPKRRWDRGFFALPALIRELRSGRFDLALIPHRSYRSGLIAKQARIPRRIGFKNTPGSTHYTYIIDREMDKPEAARNLALLGDIPDKISAKPVIRKSEKDAAIAYHWLAGTGIGEDKLVAAIAPGSVWETKRWPRPDWATLAQMLVDSGWEVVIVGGEEDRELAEHIRDESKKGSSIHIAAGELGVRASAELLRRSNLLITNDTAPLHLAVGVGTRVLAIFGPTIPEFGFAPTGKGDRVVGLELPCRGCQIHGSNRCPLGHHDCMLRLFPEQVYQQIAEMFPAS